jgi:predicted DCC family thiol-disulfide oxidoreductase YuxK
MNGKNRDMLSNSSNRNQVLLYDDYCPLCSWYSGIFIKYGFLKAGDRIPFSQADAGLLEAIDVEKAVDEIPLFNKETGTTLYGIDALLEILSWKLPAVKAIGNIRPLKWFLRKLYKLVSYNRKVIVAKKCGNAGFDCSPGFNTRYRLLFMFLFLSFNSAMLMPLHRDLLAQLSFYHLSFGQLQLAHLAFVFLNCTISIFLGPRKAIEYLGQVNMLALLTILFLTAGLIVSQIMPLPQWTIVSYLCLLTPLVIREYFRRMNYAGVLPSYKVIIALNLGCLIVFLGYLFH